MLRKSSRYMLGLFWILAGLNHFWEPAFYLSIMPSYLPRPEALVALSGATEMIVGVMVLFAKSARLGALFIYLHLALFMMVHIDMVVNYSEKYADFAPYWAVWLRIPIQGFLAWWAYWATRKV